MSTIEASNFLANASATSSAAFEAGLKSVGTRILLIALMTCSFRWVLLTTSSKERAK